MSGSKRQQQLLNQALATPPSDRSAFLDSACAGDQSLRKEIEIKIANYQTDSGNEAAQSRIKSALIPARLKQALKQDYELQERLGGGGMCDLYLATHKSLGGKWAVKVLAEMLSKDPRVVERFITEAKIEANLQHPNIVKVFNIGEAGEYHYFVMEYIEGRDLTKQLQAGPLSETETAAIAIQVCSALQCAHDNNIVHRDLKPSNVRIDKYGSVYVLDFGIARARDMAQSNTLQSETLGTPLYMSPEQIRGEEVDARSDLYSLGVLIYEMLTGRNPFEADNTHAVYSKHFSFVPEPPAQMNPRVSKPISDLVLRLLEKEPNRRFQSIAEVAGALKSLGIPAVVNTEGRAAEPQQPDNFPVGAAPPIQSTSSPRISAPRRLRVESTNSRQVPESLHSTPQHRNRLTSSGRLSSASIPVESGIAGRAMPIEAPAAGHMRDYFAAHQRWIIAGAMLLALLLAIIYLAFRPSAGSEIVEIDAAPFAQFRIVDSKENVVSRGDTPATLQLGPGNYKLIFNYEGNKRSMSLEIKRGKPARIREDFWKEQLNGKIDALLDEYLGETQ